MKNGGLLISFVLVLIGLCVGKWYVDAQMARAREDLALLIETLVDGVEFNVE